MARENWGCDTPLSFPILELECIECSGRSPNCARCSGSGRVSIYRCPWKLIQRSDALAVQAAVAFAEHGTLPDPGGYLDQTGAFLDILNVVLPIRNEAHERQIREANRSG